MTTKAECEAVLLEEGYSYNRFDDVWKKVPGRRAKVRKIANEENFEIRYFSG